jgi:GT2 family glycosyltransferase/glycosyltransferase involved in cell wall biosynthesis
MTDPSEPRPDAPPPVTQVVPGTPPRLSLRERIVLTYRYQGRRVLVQRLLTYPLRYTPLRHRFQIAPSHSRGAEVAARWYRANGRPVTIVIPSYKDLEAVSALVRSLRATTEHDRVRIVIADDASGPDHVAGLRALDRIEVIAGEENRGFAANVNRGLAAADPELDVVLLNSDMLARPGWLACLQWAASREESAGIVGAKLLYPDGRIQFGGTVRNLGAPEWFDHRFRFRPGNWGPANVAGPSLAVSGACMYLKRGLLDAIGGFDESYPMAYEDVDLCLRAWQAGFKVMYFPNAELTHLESISRGSIVGERERVSQRHFWDTWGPFFDRRDVTTEAGRLRVVYVTEGTGVGGGHRDVFEHLNRLHQRDHEVELWTLAPPPDWFALEVPVRTFGDYDELVEALAPVDAIKIATWWNTAMPVWMASVLHGIPVFFVQDVETSYYPGNAYLQDTVLASYRPEFRYMTISSWNRDRLRELGLDAVLIPPGIDLDTFRVREDVRRRDDMILALGRGNPLKNFPLTLGAWEALPEPRPELCLFGIEPDVAPEDPRVRYLVAPTDDEVGRLFSEATVFVQTSMHEGFCLPPLESMAAGGAVVCTDAHGNRDFCRDGENCLMRDAEVRTISGAIARLLADEELRRSLGKQGVQTAAEYAWERRIDALEEFLQKVAQPRTIDPCTDAVPEIRKARVV